MLVIDDEVNRTHRYLCGSTHENHHAPCTRTPPVAVVVILVYVMQWHDCSETGGVLVQGAWWFSCVEPHK